jgi:hypothetical protein
MMAHPSRPEHYEIRVEGALHEGWSTWFEGLRVSAEGAQTVISGQLADQSALHGVLTRIRDLGMHLISVRPIDAGDQRDEEEVTPS